MNDRARMPFALVGVIVLVASTTLSATVVTHDPASTPTVDRAMEGAKSETVTALRTASDRAATEAAANPVTVPANSTAGRALDDDQPFRDALRLRLYLLASERLETVAVERGGVVATASLPSVPNTTEGYRDAIERVHVGRAGPNGTALRVEISGVRLTGVHQDREVATEALSPTFVVSNPALFLHDRTERFERRANAPIDHPGLAQRTTARLYPLAWARGYAQYGGAPIANVVGTRHVELVTNDALVAEQRTVFGAADPGADRGVAAAGAAVAAEDLLAARGVDHNWTTRILDEAEGHAAGRGRDTPVGTRHEPPDDTAVTVGVNGSATMAYADTVGIDHDDRLEAAIERAHTVQARVATDVTPRGTDTERRDSVDGSWTRVGRTKHSAVSLERVTARPPRADGWETRDGASFRAVLTETTERTWRRDGEVRTTRTVVTERYRVDVAVQARTVPVAGAPQGRLDGPLASTTERAVDAAIDQGRGYAAVAKQAARDEPPAIRANATAEPTVDRTTVRRDVRALRDRTRNVTTTVPATEVGAGRANPPERLLETVTGTHDELRGRADRTVRERTRVAAREVYLTELERRLGDRADTQTEVNGGLTDAITNHVSSTHLDGALSAPRTQSHPSRRTWTDPAGNLSLAVETGPSYLPTGKVERDRIGARGGGTVHPLKTRNLNLFTTPHGQVARGILDRLPILQEDDTTSLATAAQVLAGMNESDDGYEPLRSAVAAATEHVRGELVQAMTDEGVPSSAAEDALATDDSTPVAAKLLTNGSTVDRTVAATAGQDGVDRDRLRVRLEAARRDALRDEQARPSLSTASEAERELKREFRNRLEARAADNLEKGIQRGRKKLLGKRMGALPAGLPLTPPLTTWWATANVWVVEVNGTYERFVVRANRSDGRLATTYVREGRAATLTHDSRELHLGRDDHVSFRTETVVIVVVPAGPRGVGDTDGVMDETSPGWPPEGDDATR